MSASSPAPASTPDYSSQLSVGIGDGGVGGNEEFVAFGEVPGGVDRASRRKLVAHDPCQMRKIHPASDLPLIYIQQAEAVRAKYADALDAGCRLNLL